MLSVPRQAARLPAAHGHYVHVGIAVVVAGEGDELPIGREVRAGFHARPHGEALRVRAVAVGQPDVAGIVKASLSRLRAGSRSSRVSVGAGGAV